MSASEDLHSTMTERVFKIRCSERVQVDKSTSAFSSIVSTAELIDAASVRLKMRRAFVAPESESSWIAAQSI